MQLLASANGRWCGELLPELLNEAEVAKWNEVNGPTLACGAEVAELKEKAMDEVRRKSD